MVSLWPWKGDDSSPASFEKALSALSTKIAATQTRLEGVRSASRRVRVLWTLYLTFAYLVYAIVVFLVVGWQRMGPWEWTGVAGAPVLIFLTRTGLAAFYNFRIESLSSRLRDQQKERAKTIQKLKDATKYDSTLELLEKYGGPENKPSKKGKKGGGGEDNAPPSTGDKKPRHSTGPGGPARTGMLPPPTANVPRGDRGPGSSLPGTPQPASSSHRQLGTPQHLRSTSDAMTPSAEFAPNAFGPGSPPSAQYDGPAVPPGTTEPHWYDRILDLLLGEDETAPKNRIVLICKECRLVNGQAPPGTLTLSELGTWRCMACGAKNGEVDEGKRIVQEVLSKTPKQPAGDPRWADGSSEADHDDGSSELVEVEKEDEPDTDEGPKVTTPDKGQEEQAGPRRRKGKGKK